MFDRRVAGPCGAALLRTPICEQCWLLIGGRMAAIASGATSTRWTVYPTVIALAELGRGADRVGVELRLAAAIQHLPDELVVPQLRQLARQLGEQHPIMARWRCAWRIRRDQANSLAAGGESSPVVAATPPADVSERPPGDAPATSELAPGAASTPPIGAQTPRGRSTSPEGGRSTGGTR